MKTLRNETDRRSLIERLEKLKGDEKPIWGKMTLEQMLSHLVQAGELPFVASVPDHSTFLSNKVIKPLVLYVIPIPKEVKTRAELDQQRSGRAPLGFHADRANVIESISALGTLTAEHKCLAHPFFGKMSATAWGRLAYKHIDHHLRQFGV